MGYSDDYTTDLDSNGKLLPKDKVISDDRLEIIMEEIKEASNSFSDSFADTIIIKGCVYKNIDVEIDS